MRKTLCLLIALLAFSLSACSKYTGAKFLRRYLPHDIKEDLHMEDYSEDPVFQDNYAFLSSISPRPPEDICDDAAYYLLYSYRIGVIEKGYPFPTVNNMEIRSATWEGSTATTDRGDACSKGTLFFETADGKEYSMTFDKKYGEFLFECITDKELIDYKSRD